MAVPDDRDGVVHGVSGPGQDLLMIVMAEGPLAAEQRGLQWTVRDATGATVGWISPACGTWVVSVFDVAGAKPPGAYADPHAALVGLAAWLEVNGWPGRSGPAAA